MLEHLFGPLADGQRNRSLPDAERVNVLLMWGHHFVLVKRATLLAANGKPSDLSSSIPPDSRTILKIEELKAFMEKEFKKLREEIKSLKK